MSFYRRCLSRKCETPAPHLFLKECTVSSGATRQENAMVLGQGAWLQVHPSQLCGVDNILPQIRRAECTRAPRPNAVGKEGRCVTSNRRGRRGTPGAPHQRRRFATFRASERSSAPPQSTNWMQYVHSRCKSHWEKGTTETRRTCDPVFVATPLEQGARGEDGVINFGKFQWGRKECPIDVVAHIARASLRGRTLTAPWQSDRNDQVARLRVRVHISNCHR